MDRQLIIQGLTKRTHIDALRQMFSGATGEALISVAFASFHGVELLEERMRAYGNRMTIFVGIRNPITSHQALIKLLSFGLKIYAVDTGSASLLFHPKIYLHKSKAAAAMLIGSSNLTIGGLNNNIEAGALLSFYLADKESEKIVRELEETFARLVDDYPENVILLKTEKVVDELLASGRIIDEAARPPPAANPKRGGGEEDPTPLMKMAVAQIKGKSPQPAKPAPPKQRPPMKSTAKAKAATEFELIWESKPLSRRSLGIPTGHSSNPTGSTTLGSGNFAHIDRVSYFRNEVFGDLEWTREGRIEVADASFELVIKGVLQGTFILTLRHSLTRAAAAAKDKNSPTNLSWNEARAMVANADLLGRTMRIWRDSANSRRFRIDID